MRGKGDIAGSGKHPDNVPDETHAVSVMELTLVATRASIPKKNGHPLLHLNRRQHKTERKHHLLKRMKNRLTGGVKSHATGEIVPIRCVVAGTLPCVRATFHKHDADIVEIVSSDMLS